MRKCTISALMIHFDTKFLQILYCFLDFRKILSPPLFSIFFISNLLSSFSKYLLFERRIFGEPIRKGGKKLRPERLELPTYWFGVNRSTDWAMAPTLIDFPPFSLWFLLFSKFKSNFVSSVNGCLEIFSERKMWKKGHVKISIL